MRPIRLTVVQTHPVQYFAPWFRHVAARCPDLDLTVVHAVDPSPEQQGVGYGRGFRWDTDLLGGYRHLVVRGARAGESVASDGFFDLDVPELVPAVRATRPEVVLVPGWHSVTLLRAIAACRADGVPLVYRGENWVTPPLDGPRAFVRALRTRALLSLYDAWLAIGSRAEAWLREHGALPGRIFRSPYAVDNEHFERTGEPFRQLEARRGARRGFGVDEQDFVVLFVGRLIGHKRFPDVVKAVARLGPHAVLLSVGGGEGEADARALASRVGARVAWAGFLNQSEIARAYAAADVLALPSDGEQWGLVVNEALASGLPCVVSDACGCTPDLIEPGATGDRFVPRDVEDLVAALTRLRVALDAGRDFSLACRARAASHSYTAATAGLLAACAALTRA